MERTGRCPANQGDPRMLPVWCLHAQMGQGHHRDIHKITDTFFRGDLGFVVSRELVSEEEQGM